MTTKTHHALADEMTAGELVAILRQMPAKTPIWGVKAITVGGDYAIIHRDSDKPSAPPEPQVDPISGGDDGEQWPKPEPETEHRPAHLAPIVDEVTADD